MKKRLLGPCVTFFPQPATLLASRDASGEVNLMMASWVGVVSKTPPTIAVSLHQNRKTYANILASGVFSVNVVPAPLAAVADACGLASGHKVNKAQLAGLATSAAALTGAPLINEAPLNVECRYLREVELGEYRLVLAEIVEIHACEEAFDAQGKADIKVFDPLVYLGGIREYWSLGAMAAQAYRAGLDLLPKE